MDQVPQLLTIEDCMERTRLGRRTIHKLIASGELESILIGRARRIPEDALAAWINSKREQT
jgi:excisionase family DNA binding protein